MNDSELLRTLVRRGICSGYGSFQIFNDTLRSLNHSNHFYQPLTVERWLENLKNTDSKSEPPVPKEFQLLLQTIRQEFEKVAQRIEKQRCPKENYLCQLSILNERYSLDMLLSYKKRYYSLYLIDNFYGYKRLVLGGSTVLSPK